MDTEITLATPAAPIKTRDMHSHHFDSTIWDDFTFRDDDIIISTYAKSGTTWMQQIISQLIFDGVEGLPVADMSPWVDLRVPPKEHKLPLLDAQTHRRFLKTHLPVDALVWSEKAKYIYIGRDGRDVVWSLYNHHANANDAWYGALNDTPGRVGPPIEPPGDDIVEYFEHWLDNDGAPFWSFWDNAKSWWNERSRSNVRMIHFDDLKRDFDGEVDRIAAFLDLPLSPDLMDKLRHHCSFDYMKANATESVPLGGAFWDGGARTFIHKGQTGRWRDVLPEDLSQRYERMAVERLGPACATWFKRGSI